MKKYWIFSFSLDHECLLHFLLRSSLILLVPFLIHSKIRTQSITDTIEIKKEEKRLKVIGFPILFYLPETRLAGGGAGSLTFRLKGDSINSYPSNIVFGAAYTQNRQLLSYINFRVFTDNEKYLNYGEVGYFIYNYFFYGVGNENPQDYEEFYGITFPRLRWHSLIRVSKPLYVGVRVDYDHYRLHDLEDHGFLKDDIYLGAPAGVKNKGIGFVINFDTRNFQFYPSKGIFVESLLLYTNTQYLEGHKNTGKGFVKFIFDGSLYISPVKNHIIAFNAHTEFNFGAVPFQSMALLGGARRMRGYYEGRFRDQHFVLIQAEYRMPVYGILGAVAFLSAGNVFSDEDIFKWKYTRLAGGLGIRIKIDRKDLLNLRMDYGIAKNSNAFYLTFREAF